MRTDNLLAYPDVNPFFNPQATASEGPTLEDVQQAGGSATARRSPTTETAPAKPEKPTQESPAAAQESGKPTTVPSPFTWAPWTLGGFVLLIVLGVVFMRLRSRKSTGPPVSDVEVSRDSPAGSDRQ